MKQLKDITELDGKTIKRTAYLENKIFLFFTDDTFVIIKGCGYGQWDVEIYDDDFNLQPSEYNLDDLKEIGVLGDEEYNKLKAEKVRKYTERQTQMELEKLAELKNKYPNH